MTRLEYLLLALKSGSYMYKEWIIECFAKSILPPKPENPDYTRTKEKIYGGLAVVAAKEDKIPQRYTFEHHPCQPFSDGEAIVFCHPETQEWTVIQDCNQSQPFFRFKDQFKLKRGDLINLDRDVETWVGNIITNQIALVYPFGNLIPFITGTFTPKDIEKRIEPLLVRTPPEAINNPSYQRDETKIYTDVLEELYYQAIFSIEGWCQLAVPAATPYTLMTSPKIAEMKRKLIEENREAIDRGDVVVITNIMNQLIEEDKRFQALDPESGFLKCGRNKLFNVVRAKEFLMYGIEWDFNDPTKAVLIEKPLTDEWEIDKLPAMANSIIAGSFNRGAETALGGELAKIITRFFLNTFITEKDCKTNIGNIVTLEANDVHGYDSTYMKIDQKWQLMTEADLKKYIGKRVEIRSPLYCHTGDNSFCLACMGTHYENLVNSLASLATSVGNTIMYIFMKRMHGVALATVEWDLDELF